MLSPAIRRTLLRGGVIPAHPLALTARRRLDERRQRALTRYYLDAGAVGVAIGVHTTQFAIRDPRIGLYRPVLALGAETVSRWTRRPIVRIAGISGPTRQAVAEANAARDLGYHVGLVSLGGLGDWTTARLLAHVHRIGEVIPVMGFYLQPAVGGRVLDYGFWRRLAELESVVAIKVAPFDRYWTLDVARAVADAGRSRDLALYTGNDDAIVTDLVTRYRFPGRRSTRTVATVGGLLGHWAVWTRAAVKLHARCRIAARSGRIPRALLALGNQVTDANAALFDAAHGFRGCIPGIHEVLRRQGLMAGRWCLDPAEELSPGQMAEIDRVLGAYPHLRDDGFVARNLARWLE
jgi:hypothetical protein